MVRMARSKNSRLPHPTLLMILDGFGLADAGIPGNAITPETAPKIFSFMKRYPWAPLAASGEAVGLFRGQNGNSEAGHMNIGAGRVVKQDLVRISDAIHDGTFFKNPAFTQALYHAKKYRTAVHILSLLTDGHSAHAYPEHLFAMLEFFRREKQEDVYLHLFTDGRDSPPHAALTFLHELRGHLLSHEKIATVMGRFYAMDRTKTWDRTRQAYDAIVGGRGACTAPSAEDAIAQAYNRGETDEFVCPTVITNHGRPIARVGDNDVVYFANARSDRARQLTKAFVQTDFEAENPGAFRRKTVPKNIRFVTMTDFGPDLPGILAAFPGPDIRETIAAVIGNRYRQLYISETEKYAHITYFVNGGFAAPVNGEDRDVVKSPLARSYAECAEMSIAVLEKKVADAFKKDRYDFVCVNFPNADMVGHTGDLAAAKKAVRAVDDAVGALTELVLSRGGMAMIVGDHGNAERMLNPDTHEVDTGHTANQVPCLLIARDIVGKTLKSGGKLADVAPTLIKCMGVPKPKIMTGRSLI